MSFFTNLFNRKRYNQDEINQELEAGLSLDEEDYEEEESNGHIHEMSEIEESEEQVEYEVVEREIHPAKIICPDCGGVTLEGLELCDKCGGELQ